MLLHYFWTFGLIQINGFIIPEVYNTRFTDSAHYKIDVRLLEGDLEMISEDQSQIIDEKDNNEDQSQSVDEKDKENQLFELIRLAIKENSKVNKPVYWVNLNDVNFVTTTGKTTRLTTNSKSTESTTTISKNTRVPLQKEKKHHNSTVYDYDRFLKEYYDDTVYVDQQNDTYHPKAEGQNLLESLKGFVYLGDGNNSGDANYISLRAVKNLSGQSGSTVVFAGRLWRLVKVWLLVYLAIAVPLWCTQGWSCCCLCCKVFKPYLTIEEAKNYYIQNPPGIQKDPKGHTLYEPSEKERECYLELEHLIKII